MAFRFPFTNLQELNLDWILTKVKNMSDETKQLKENVDTALADVDDAVESANAAARSINNMTVGAVTLGAGEDATVVKGTIDGHIDLEFGIPKGSKGDPGERGADGQNATDAQVQQAVNTWLTDNVDPDSGYVLDRTLTQSDAAAPADLTGDIKESVVRTFQTTANYSPGQLVRDPVNGWICQFTKYHAAGAWTGTDVINILDLNTPVRRLMNDIASSFDERNDYAIGDYVLYTTTLYRFTAAHTANTPWNSSEVMAVKITEELSDLNQQISAKPSLDRTLTQAQAAAPADLVGELETNILSSGGMFPSGMFRRGSINSSGSIIASTYRVCTKEPFKVVNDMNITAKEGFYITLWLYPENAVAYTKSGIGVSLPANTDVNILIRRIDEDSTETADINEFVNALFLSYANTESQEINKTSYGIVNEQYENITYVDLLSKAVSVDNRTAKIASFEYDKTFQHNPFSILAETNDSTSSEIRFTISSPIQLMGTQEFEMCVYVEDATLITGISLRTITGGFSKSITSGLVNGWNKLRFVTEGAGNITFDENIVTFRVIAYHSANTDSNIIIGSLVQIKPQYANLLVIADGPYKTFYDLAYPALKNLGVPVIWALDPTLLAGDEDEERQLINHSELELLAYDGISEFSFHSYDLTIMSSATAEQALRDTVNNIRFLKKNGIQPNHIWRAAWLQNSCADPSLANQEVEASASYDNSNGVVSYPFPERYNIPRTAMHNRTTTYFDSLFDKLKYQHCTLLLYAHGVSEGSDKEITPTMLTYLLGKISAAITEGYLNPTTYSRMVEFYKKI